MTLMDIAAGVLIGNLFASAALYGVHMAIARDREPGQVWFGIVLALVPALLILANAIGESDGLRTTAAAAFLAAVVTVVFLWGVNTIMRHEKTGDYSMKAWTAVLVPILVGIVWLWPYAPIG